MNIFYLDESFFRSAEMMVDKHVVKMMLEYTQMLCTAIHENSPDMFDESYMYKPTHINHPCNIWVRESKAHWSHLRGAALALEREWNHRFHNGGYKRHKSILVVDKLPTPEFDTAMWSDPPQCMPDDCKCNSVIEAYREYYRKHKKHLHQWTGRVKPEWI